MSKTATRISKLGTVVIPVSDQDRATEFYVETLGFEKRADVPFGNGYRWVEVGPVGAETTIAIVPPPPGKTTRSAAWATPSRRCSGSAIPTATP